jgi:hypothetical protein
MHFSQLNLAFLQNQSHFKVIYKNSHKPIKINHHFQIFGMDLPFSGTDFICVGWIWHFGRSNHQQYGTYQS